MSSILKSRSKWPLLLSLLAYWMLVGFLLAASIRENQGAFVYPLDDTYIHMAIAKHVAQDGVWGVSSLDGFSSATSSPLWTLVLALFYRVFGVNDFIPLGLNLVFGSLAIFLGYLLLSREFRNPIWNTVILFLAIFLTPLPTLTLIGMEHTLHILLSLGFVIVCSRNITQPRLERQSFLELSLLAGLLVATRYEGMFLLLFACGLLLLTHKLLPATLTGLAGLLPISLYGLWSKSQGWYFLPNSVILKGNTLPTSPSAIIQFALQFFERLTATPSILLLIIAAALTFYVNPKEQLGRAEKRGGLILFAASALTHMMFASTGYYFRYEAYLVFWGIMSIASCLPVPNHFKDTRNEPAAKLNVAALLLVAGLFLIPFLLRSLTAYEQYPTATNNVFQQQIQMGKFIRQYYQGKVIAANDIGAINYLADIHTIDLVGLATLKPARWKLQGQYSTKHIQDLTEEEQVVIAFVYENWYKALGGLPENWTRVGQWQIKNNVVGGGNTISIFAVQPSEKEALMANLLSFSTSIPASIIQLGEYTNH